MQFSHSATTLKVLWYGCPSFDAFTGTSKVAASAGMVSVSGNPLKFASLPRFIFMIASLFPFLFLLMWKTTFPSLQSAISSFPLFSVTSSAVISRHSSFSTVTVAVAVWQPLSSVAVTLKVACASMSSASVVLSWSVLVSLSAGAHVTFPSFPETSGTFKTIPFTSHPLKVLSCPSSSFSNCVVVTSNFTGPLVLFSHSAVTLKVLRYGVSLSFAFTGTSNVLSPSGMVSSSGKPSRFMSDGYVNFILVGPTASLPLVIWKTTLPLLQAAIKSELPFSVIRSAVISTDLSHGFSTNVPSAVWQPKTLSAVILKTCLFSGQLIGCTVKSSLSWSRLAGSHFIFLIGPVCSTLSSVAQHSALIGVIEMLLDLNMYERMVSPCEDEHEFSLSIAITISKLSSSMSCSGFNSNTTESWWAGMITSSGIF